jgi:hypothetical protein
VLRAGAGTFGRSRNIEVSAPAPGSGSAKVEKSKFILKRIYSVKCELGRYSFTKNMKNVLFNIKSVITGSSKAIAGAGAGAGAGTF